MSSEHPEPSEGTAALAAAATWVVRAVLLGFVAILAFSLLNASGRLLPDQIALFYLLPLAGAGFCGWLLRTEGSRRILFAMLVLSSGIALVLAETVLSVALSTAPRPDGGEIPTAQEVIRELRAQGDQAYPTVPGNALVDEDLGFQLASGLVHPMTTAPAGSTVVLCTEGRVVTYPSDRLGFNNPDSIWDNPVDVVAIGDSYTAGMCVEHPDQYPSVLRATRTTLNLGIRGSGPLQELAVLREYAAPLRPPVVVWTYYEGNDGYDYRRELQRDWLVAYLEPEHTQNLLEHQTELDQNYREWLDSLLATGYYDASAQPAGPGIGERIGGIVRLRALRRFARIGTPVPRRGSGLQGLPDVIVQARDEVESWGGRFIVVYMPAYLRYSTLLSDGMWDRPELLRTLNDHGVQLVDMDVVFTTEGDARRFWTTPLGHLTPEGYALTAQQIAEAIDTPPAP